MAFFCAATSIILVGFKIHDYVIIIIHSVFSVVVHVKTLYRYHAKPKDHDCVTCVLVEFGNQQSTLSRPDSSAFADS